MSDGRQSSTAFFKSLFHSVPSACLVLDPELRIIEVTERYLQATMTRREQILGRALFDVFPDDPNDPKADGTRNLRASLDRVRQQLRPDRMAVQLYPIRRPDGSFEQRHWQPINTPVLDEAGHLQCILHQVEDVTRQAEAEAGLKALALGPQAALAAFFDGMFEGVQVVDREGRYVYLNATAAAQGRSTREALVGRRMEEVYPGIEGTEMYRRLRACLAERQPQQMLNEFHYPDGGQGWFELRIEPVPLGALILSADISQQVKLEEALRSSERLESVGRLAGGIAHDFNNLVTIISGYAALMLKALPEGAAQRDDLAQIQLAGERAGDLTRQLLAFSRKQVLEPKVVDLNSSLKAVLRLLQRVIGEDIELVVNLAEPLDRVRVDPGQLEQIIMNLALNARDAMPGGGKLVLETSNVVLDEAYCDQHAEAKPGRHVALAVSDTGHGMDPATQRRIFEPFFTTKQLGRGTGLGLSTVHGIVKQSGGNIWVYSEPEQGTCFKVYLPALADSVAAEAPQPIDEGGLDHSGCILLVEDEEGVRRLFETVLRSAGYQVLSASGAERALEICRLHPGSIDLLLTDVVLKGKGGVPMAKEAAAIRPKMKVVFMSGYTENAIVHQGVLDAGTAFIGKPVSPALLLKKIREQMQGS